MQLAALTGHLWLENAFDTEFFDRHPWQAHLPGDLSEILVQVLAPHTRTQDRCWFAVWDGFGALRSEVREAPAFELPKRRYHLLTGPVSAATEPVETPPWWQTANLWWPEDHAWCVASEIDLNSTYIGCSQACADGLLAEGALEAYEIDPATGITWLSDTVNPEPERG